MTSQTTSIAERVKSLSQMVAQQSNLRLSKLRPSLRFKITLPYILLSILIAAAGAFIVTQLIVESVQERYLNQLLETGRLATDRVVKIEQENLATLRAIAHTDGVAQALLDADAESARNLIFPLAVNDRADVVRLLDRQGIALLSLYRQRDGQVADYEITQGDDLADWPLVDKVSTGQSDQIGDKFADLITDSPQGAILYISGPIWAGDERVGVILVGSYLQEITRDLNQASGSHVTLYDQTGTPLVTTFDHDTAQLGITAQDYAETLEQQTVARTRSVQVAGRNYGQTLAPFEARHGQDLAVLSTALAEDFAVSAEADTRIRVFLLVTLALFSVIIVGTLIARLITRPILAIAQASRQVAQGDLSQQVQIASRDEVGDLAQAFNEMVAQLRQGELIKDIFGRAVSPEVSAALIDAVSSGQVTLGGETRHVTILFSDIKRFTTLSEQYTPDQVVALLNEYIGVIYPAIAQHGGVINKFGGDSTLALFGAPIDQPDHAHRAVLTGLTMHGALQDLNARRMAQGQVPIHIGVGINTGDVVVGMVGSADRLEYTVIGDPVNVASRIEGLTRQFRSHDLLISQDTLEALGPDHPFDVKDLGEHQVKGKATRIHVYSVLGVQSDA